jgi:hypothetical protein
MLALLWLGGNRLYSPTHFFAPILCRTSVMLAPRFIPLRLDDIEDIKDYQPDSYHPISVGNTFDHGRFRILHKLGFGGSSTVWPVRDQREEGDRSRLVSPSRQRVPMFPHPRSQARSPNWLFPKNLEHLSLLPSQSTFRLLITISSYKVQTALTYSPLGLSHEAEKVKVKELKVKRLQVQEAKQ